jgi:phosphate/sulfate permease
MGENNNHIVEIKELTFLGKSMERVSIIYGIFLIIWGVVVSFISGSNSLTSFIPSIFGLPVLLFSFLAVKFPSKKKLFMHIVVSFGLIVFIGGLDFSRGLLKGTSFNNLWADTSKLMMLITGLIFTFLCVKSFIFARKNKQ